MKRFVDTDSYKISHYNQYPPDTTGLIAYFEARRGAEHEDIVFFGLRPLLEAIHGPTAVPMEYMHELFEAHGLTFNRKGWQYILDEYDGALPARIYALPEGTVAAPGDPLMFVQSTDAKVPWVTTWLETMLARVWYPSTVASSSRAMRKMLHKAWAVSSDSPIESLDFKLHDFGSRGATSSESAMLGGMAHLVNFKGTDNVIALHGTGKYYGTTAREPAGFSIPASEHSTVTSWGADGEEAFLHNLINKFGGPGKMVAFVADSYNMHDAIAMVIRNSDFIKNSGTTLVVRPDSGNPTKVPLQVLDQLAEGVGVQRNSKNYYVLPDHLRVIQGDGMVPATLNELVDRVLLFKYSLDNIAFGMGAGLIQKVDRDTERFAYKVCGIARQGGPYVDVVKNPATDPTKRSKGWDEVRHHMDRMELVYDKGRITKEHSWADVVERGKYLG